MSACRLMPRRNVATAIVVLVVFNVCGCAVSQYARAPEVINPLDYGLNEAKTGEERFASYSPRSTEKGYRRFIYRHWTHQCDNTR